MEIRLKKEPHAQQQKFIDADEPEQLYGGAKRGGKTIALCQKSALLNVMFPGNRGLICRYNFTDLQDTTLTEFFNTVPSDLILNHHKGERTIVLRTVDNRCSNRVHSTKDGWSEYASRQLYRGLGDPEEFEKVKGMSLGHLEIDEPSEVPFAQFLMLRAQLDWRLPDGSAPPYMTLLASNPEPGWVEDRFLINPGKGRVFIPSLPRDNPHLPPGYEAELRANYPPDWVAKYLDGTWGASEGAVFKELDDRIHNLDNWIDPRDGNKWFDWVWPMTLTLSIDHASTGYVAMVIIATDYMGNHFAIDEYYDKEHLITEHCLAMRGVLDKYLEKFYTGNRMTKEVDYMLIDPATCQRTQQGQTKLQAVVDDYREGGFPCIPAWNALELGLNRIKEHLHLIPTHKHPFNGLMGSPSLYISKTRCPNLWEEMRTLKKQVKPDGKIKFIGKDHAIDDVRYILLSKPQRPELQQIDERHLDSLTLAKKRSEDKWVRQWDKQVQSADTASGTFSGSGKTVFRGMGFN